MINRIPVIVLALSALAFAFTRPPAKRALFEATVTPTPFVGPYPCVAGPGVIPPCDPSLPTPIPPTSTVTPTTTPSATATALPALSDEAYATCIEIAWSLTPWQGESYVDPRWNAVYHATSAPYIPEFAPTIEAACATILTMTPPPTPTPTATRPPYIPPTPTITPTFTITATPTEGTP